MRTQKNTFWVASELFYPAVEQTGYILTKIAEGCAKAGMRTKILTAQPREDHGTGGLEPKISEHNGMLIYRCWQTRFEKDRLLGRSLNLISICLSIFLSSLFKVKKGDTLLVVTNPPTLPIFLLIACRIKRAKCIIKVDDTYPDVLAACGVLSPKSLPYRLLNRIYIWVYNAADEIIVVGRDMRARLIEKIGERPNINVITHWADIDIIHPEDRKNNTLLTELNLHDKFIVLWAGNMGLPHEINTLFDAIKKLSSDERIHFLFIGSGAKRPAFEAKVRNEGLKNVTFTGKKPRSEQQGFLNACDIGITAIISGLTGVSVPSRSYNIFASGKPILAIADPGGEISQVIEENNLGWVINPGDSDGLSSAILSALETPSILDDIRINARKLVETKYSRSHVISRYVKIINQCALR